MSKMLQFNQEALKSLSRGIKTLLKAVIVTLGPKGRNVVIRRKFGSPLSTKDGVTVAQEIVLRDRFENMGVQMVKEASAKTGDIAGDGTTTAIVLTEAIYSEGIKRVVAGANPMSVKRGIDKTVAELCKALDEMAIKINKREEIEPVAAVSANNDPEIGSLIALAMEKVGKDGVITVVESKGIETTLDVVEGLQFSGGYLSPYFVTDPEKMGVEFENSLIFVTDKKISSAKDVVAILENVNEKGSRPIVIIADDIEGEALTTLVLNKVQGGLSVCAVKAPEFGELRKELLSDIAIRTGATLVTGEAGMNFEGTTLATFGQAKRVKITKDKTTLIAGNENNDLVQGRIREIREKIATSKLEYEIKKLKERLAKLVGVVAVIHVGAATKGELEEKKSRVDDSLHATYAGVAEGIVPGGGVALIQALKKIDLFALEGDEQVGVEIVKKACLAPATAIANNCGKQGNLIAEKIYERQGSWGFNGLTGKFADLVKEGIVDPVLVTKGAFRSAASVAGSLLTVTVMITDKPKKKSKAASRPSYMDEGEGFGEMDGMGGMDGMM